MKKKLSKLTLSKQTLSNLSAQAVTGGISGSACGCGTGGYDEWTKGKNASCGYTMAYDCNETHAIDCFSGIDCW